LNKFVLVYIKGKFEGKKNDNNEKKEVKLCRTLMIEINKQETLISENNINIY